MTTTQKKLAALPNDARDAVEYAITGKALPVHVTRYVGKIKVEKTFNGKTTWSLHDQIKKLANLELDTFTSWADVIRTAMEFLGQGDEGFAQLIRIPVSNSGVEAGRARPQQPRKETLGGLNKISGDHVGRRERIIGSICLSF